MITALWWLLGVAAVLIALVFLGISKTGMQVWYTGTAMVLGLMSASWRVALIWLLVVPLVIAWARTRERPRRP